MSCTALATALVVPFEHLRMTDVEVGRRQERQPRRNDQPARRHRACGCPAVLPPRPTPSASSWPRRPGRHASTPGWPRWTPTTCARWPRPARRSAPGSRRTPFPADLEAAIRAEFATLTAGNPGASFAVRSSATAEDLPDASFAGQQETFLNVVGIDDVLHKMKEVFASLYNDRAISYRVHKGFAHADVALSAGVQRMVRSDLGAAGVMFTIDTESRLQGRGVHHLQLRPGRDGGAGRGEPGRVLRAQADAGGRQAGRHPPQPGLQADPDGVRLARGEGRQRQAGARPSTRRPSSATATR